MNKRQYLFNVRLFEEKWTECPAILCFPTYFFYTVSTVLNTYTILRKIRGISVSEKVAIETLLDGWFHILLPLVLTLLRACNEETEIDLVPPSEMRDILRNAINQYWSTKKPLSPTLFTLEHYMTTDESRQTYRQVLKTTSLRLNKVHTLCDLIGYLTSTGCCPKTFDLDETVLPDSLHYTRFTTGTHPTARQGPREWGPYYWKIFHDVTRHPPVDEVEREEYLYLLDSLPSILPVTVPCLTCRFNYLQHVRPSTIPISLTDHSRIYEMIHTHVSKHVG